MKINNLNDLTKHMLLDMYSAENQIIEALPKMIKAAQSDELKQALSNHLDETKQQSSRLEQVASTLDVPYARVEKCKAMQAIIEEGEDSLKNCENDSMIDFIIIAGSLRIEHYEIAGYDSLIECLNILDLDDEVEMLQQTRDEESQAANLLTSLLENIDVDVDVSE